MRASLLAFDKNTRVLRQSGVIDSRRLTIRLRSAEDKCHFMYECNRFTTFYCEDRVRGVFRTSQPETIAYERDENRKAERKQKDDQG